MAEFNWREIRLGLGTIAVTLIILVALTVGTPQTDSSSGLGFDLHAEFGKIDGLTVGSPVRMAGIDIGLVGSVSLGDHHRANVTLAIFDSNLAIPSDTAAVIETDGIFGEKYIELHPGGDIETLSPGQRLSYVQDSVVLESLLNQVVNRAKTSRLAEQKDLP
ncbi:MAG: MCE family protein [Rhodospirillaceae bacterium]|jgi:phospholipid/cholesterol/gamma-HCH transport system substrate-binding protein|nr:MCE family protein [Rhodospirillaceae bacterium]MBT5241822.1 MCE family protein [Rhodospirillaceae bacterium]MBT5566666.1 MCE family protein [Rhodospirillaceae bacterium]MBT6087968.1 MCE family protein [Rhodospirillaceae bacterium]MBT6961740.1 MCE family protein [Rhodospirillaceae bacterium]